MSVESDTGDRVGVEVARVYKRSSLSVFPLLLGLLILALDMYLLMNLPGLFLKNLQSGISLALIFASVIVCVFLIAYAFGIDRINRDTAGDPWRASSPYATWVVVPLLLGLVAVASTVGGMMWNRSAGERQSSKPCIEIYQQAQSIAKENPRFRMAASDRDEVRCGVNAAIGR